MMDTNTLITHTRHTEGTTKYKGSAKKEIQPCQWNGNLWGAVCAVKSAIRSLKAEGFLVNSK